MSDYLGTIISLLGIGSVVKHVLLDEPKELVRTIQLIRDSPIDGYYIHLNKIKYLGVWCGQEFTANDRYHIISLEYSEKLTLGQKETLKRLNDILDLSEAMYSNPMTRISRRSNAESS